MKLLPFLYNASNVSGPLEPTGDRPLRSGSAFLPWVALLVGFAAASCLQRPSDEQGGLVIDALNMAGEATPTSVILQVRLAVSDTLIDQDIPGFAGWGRLEVAEDASFQRIRSSEWLRASAENDYMLKVRMEGLEPGARYYYRARAGADTSNTMVLEHGAFRTLRSGEETETVRFVMISCMNYEKFYGLGRLDTQSDPSEWVEPAAGQDRELGYPAFEVLRRLAPDFWIGNGDNVYYDSPPETPERYARTVEEMRAKWHRQFSMPRARAVLGEIPAYWLKDDHDYRYNDADTTGDRLPRHDAGVAVFREQVPVTDPAAQEPTYRTIRVNRHLQLWMVEGRDYRSPNDMEDGPEKSLWGAEQKAWLKRTLLESNATFKILVSPTPLVGPDDAYKRDNHTSAGGFRHEGTEFLNWLAENGLVSPVFFTMNGDRHWQYHSVHPLGIEEFSSGAFISQNARKGRPPGDPASTDPEARIDQPYIQTVPVGGMLEVRVEPTSTVHRPSIVFTFYDEQGEVLYTARRYAPDPS